MAKLLAGLAVDALRAVAQSVAITGPSSEAAKGTTLDYDQGTIDVQLFR